MNNPDIDSLRYPIGKLKFPDAKSDEQISSWTEDISKFPERIRSLVQSLTETELQWKYRPEGWTIRQVVHHCADSHMNAFIRFKLALTEDIPTIKGYSEDTWAELPDTLEVSVSESLYILDGLHSRWSALLRSMGRKDFGRKLFHPEHGRELTLEFMLALYSWHCRHHAEHIRQALKHQGRY